MSKQIELKPLFDRPVRILAGPCSAESESQTLAVAHGVAVAGADVFRAGVWKPRTKPGNFEGIGAPALKWLQKVKSETGLPVITEVATPEHLQMVVDAGLDGIWIGARTSANPFAMQLLADCLANMGYEQRNSLAVLVKNPVNPDLELWIGALERISDAGVSRLGAIHRGFSSYGEKYYRNTPMWRIPIELRRRYPELPLYCDPSHIGGRRELVSPLSRQALDMEFDGLIIESHCNPSEALSDPAQQITPDELRELIKCLGRHSNDNSGLLDECRRRIDLIDDELMSLLARRMDISREIGQIKQQGGIAVVQPERYRQLIERRVAEGVRLGLSADFIKDILEAIHEESVSRQLR